LKNKHEDLFEILEDDPLAFVDVDEVYVQTDPLSLIWYFTYCCALSMTVAFGFYHVHFLLKLSIYLAAFVSYAVVIAPLMTYLCEATDDCSSCNCKHSLANTSYLTHLLYLFSIVLVLHATDRQVDLSIVRLVVNVNESTSWLVRLSLSGGWITRGNVA